MSAVWWGFRRLHSPIKRRMCRPMPNTTRYRQIMSGASRTYLCIEQRAWRISMSLSMEPTLLRSTLWDHHLEYSKGRTCCSRNELVAPTSPATKATLDVAFLWKKSKQSRKGLLLNTRCPTRSIRYSYTTAKPLMTPSRPRSLRISPSWRSSTWSWSLECGQKQCSTRRSKDLRKSQPQ